MKILGLFLSVFAFFILTSPVYAQENEKEATTETSADTEQDKDVSKNPAQEKEKPEEDDPVKACFNTYKEVEEIRFCLKVAYEKAERKRRFVQEKMFEILVEQNFMSESEIAEVNKLKLKQKIFEEKLEEAQTIEQRKEAGMQKIFAAKDKGIIAAFEIKNEKAREEALEKMKSSDADFEKYRVTECERQRHFYSSNNDFAQFIFYSCMYSLTEQRTETLKHSLK